MRKASKTERGWRRRFEFSIPVAQQGIWEQRLDQRANIYFFHRLDSEDIENEILSETCQWEVPVTWSGDVLLTQSQKDLLKDTLDPSLDMNSNEQSNGDVAFAQPSEIWLPHDDVHMSNGNGNGSQQLSDDRTPGIQATGVIRSGQNKGGNRLGTNGNGLIGFSSSLTKPYLSDDSISHHGQPMRMPTTSSSTASGVAEDLLLNDDIVYALARRLGLPTEQIVPASQLQSIFTLSHEDSMSQPGSVSQYQPFTSMSSTNSIHQGTETSHLTLLPYLPASPPSCFPSLSPFCFLPSLLIPFPPCLPFFYFLIILIDFLENSGNLAPRLNSKNPNLDTEDPKYDSDDDLWSDDERLVGDMNDEDDDEHHQTNGQIKSTIPSFLPQNHADVKKFNKIQQELLGNVGVATSNPTTILSKKGKNVTKKDHLIPDLNLTQTVYNGNNPHEMNQGVIGWRKLPRPEIPAKFFEKCKQTKTLGPDIDSLANKPNNPVFLIPLSPVEACQYEPMTFTVDIESIFIPDARKDMDRVLANIERNIEREEQLSKNIPTNELLLFGKADIMTSVDNFVANQYKQDKELNRDPIQECIEKAILAAKTSNIAEMEDALEEDISIDTTDQYGNTLLILAAQQGSKKMCKYLLRRGANINAQSLSGQTALHYCYAYSHHDLGEYLKSRVSFIPLYLLLFPFTPPPPSSSAFSLTLPSLCLSLTLSVTIRVLMIQY